MNGHLMPVSPHSISYYECVDESIPQKSSVATTDEIVLKGKRREREPDKKSVDIVMNEMNQMRI